MAEHYMAHQSCLSAQANECTLQRYALFFCKKTPLTYYYIIYCPSRSITLSISLSHSHTHILYTHFLSLNPSSIQKCLPMGIERVYFCKSYPASACLPIFFASEIIPIFYVTLISVFVLHHFRPLCFSFRIFYYAF